MDIKPQRFRIHGDENAPPMGASVKTLHNRHRSSPNLSTLNAVAGAKAATRRAALGDVSASLQNAQTVRDDSAISSKGVQALKDHATSLFTKKDVAPLRQPAQRLPAVAASLKSFEASSRPVASSVLAPVANTSKPLTRSSTITAAFNSRSFFNKDHPRPRDQDPVDAKASIAALFDQRAPTAQAPSWQKFADAVTFTAKPQAAPATTTEPQQKTTLPTSLNGSEKSVNESIPKPSTITSSTHQLGVNLVTTASINEHSLETRVPVIPTVPRGSLGPSYAAARPTTTKPVYSKTDSSLALVREAEEHWEEEEDEYHDHFDDDGFATARSSRSRADNSTGNATMTLVPRVNAMAKKELAFSKQTVEAARTIEDIEDDQWDTTMVAEYNDEIFDYMRELETRMQPNAHYMDVQTEIQWSMRSVLMDWLVQVHGRFQLLPETLFLTVNYIDRFLSCKIVSLAKLQLVGATAIFVAAKYEEINCPSVAEIVYMVDRGYTVDEILKAERFMLSMLQFELGWPGPMSFLRRISKADDYDLETRTLAKYFLEITIMDERFLGCPPSFTAAGAHCLARMMLKKGNWSPAHTHYSGYTYAQLLGLIHLILECCEDPLRHHAAVYDKYQDKKYKSASQFVRTEMERGFRPADVATNAAQTMMTLCPTASWCLPSSFGQ